tara:strand:- start:212 stop:898 length:687 start_codon:yes stop_codon:yes gene_type:complete
MKRSEINEILRNADDFIRSFGFKLPPFAYWPPEKMKARRADISAIIEARLGWDITDYGQNNFDNVGLLLFTIRNGKKEDMSHAGGMCYAEKIMISRQDQVSPMHRHMDKTEDIINRGGANLAIEMFESGKDGKIDPNADVFVKTDGIQQCQKPGDILILSPGESVTLKPGNWHAFWGEGGDVLVGEVSSVNDDLNDNVFEASIGRFAEINEDVAPSYLLVSDYEAFLK